MIGLLEEKAVSMYDSFVFCGSWMETILGDEEEFGTEYAKEKVWNLILEATGVGMRTDKQSIRGWINGSAMTLVNSSKGKFEASYDKGKKGGRPQQDVDMEFVAAKREEGKSWQWIASYLTEMGCKITGEGLRKKYIQMQTNLPTKLPTQQQQPTNNQQQSQQPTENLNININKNINKQGVVKLKDINDFPVTRMDMSDEDCDTCNDFELDEDMGWGVSDDKFDEFARKHGMTVDRLYKLLTYAQSQDKYPGW